MLNKLFKRIAILVLLAALAASAAHAQGTAFTYQGRLTDGGNPADGMYDMQFKPFDTPTVGTGIQQGMTLTFSTVQVENGVFTVLLNFGSGIFTGPARFIEIGVRPTGSADPYTILEPRQAITSTPYALRASTAGGADTATNATNAAQLGGVAASQYVLTTDSRLSDARPPAAGSNNYLQNQGAIQQTPANFNISGSGTLGGTLTANAINGNGSGLTSLNASNISSGTLDTARLGIVPAVKGGTGLISSGAIGNYLRSTGTGWTTSPLLASDLPDNFNISGTGTASIFNAAIFNAATQYNLGGNRLLSAPGGVASGNTFAGLNSGISNEGLDNSFFGESAGEENLTGSGNSFFGSLAGHENITGNKNSFFGGGAGYSNTTGDRNSFFGAFAGTNNTTGKDNSFFGESAGKTNSEGDSNAFFGFNAGEVNLTGDGNSFFGTFAGEGNTEGSNNSFFGYSAGAFNTTGNSNSFFGIIAGNSNTTGSNNTIIGFNADVGASNLTNATAIGANATVSQSNSLVLGSINGVNGAMASANVGIGITAPRSKLHIQGGNLFIAQPNSLIITSPNGACWFITVNNSGALSTISTPCP